MQGLEFKLRSPQKKNDMIFYVFDKKKNIVDMEIIGTCTCLPRDYRHVYDCCYLVVTQI